MRKFTIFIGISFFAFWGQYFFEKCLTAHAYGRANGPANSNVVYAPSLSRADIQAAVNSASPGDIVQLPAGTKTNWSGTVYVTKNNLHIRGQGASNTYLKWNSPQDEEHPFFYFQGTSGCKLSGVKLGGVNDQNGREVLVRLSDCTGFEIFNCTFTRSSYASVYAQGHPVVGVIHNCLFSDGARAGIGYGVFVNGAGPGEMWTGHEGTASWNDPLDLGTLDGVYIEDCTMDTYRHFVASAYGARYIARYNTITVDSPVSQDVFDTHGAYMNQRGVRKCELYGNTIYFDNHYNTWFQIRDSGNGVIFNNTMTNMNMTPNPEGLLYLSHPCCGTETCGSYPLPDQPTSVYLWGNIVNGFSYNTAVIQSMCWDNFDPTGNPYFIKGRDWFDYPMPGYTPLAYPHPLRTSTRPVLVLSTNSLRFQAESGGSNPASQTFQVSNAGGGVLSWTVSDNASWLTCSPTSGSGNGRITVAANSAGLSVGTYNGTITVAASGAANSPQNISITLNISAHPPPLSAQAQASPTSGYAPLTVNFTGSAAGGTSPYSYRWTFGDGGSSTTQNASHTYSTIGNYTANLTVTDNASANASATVSIVVGSVSAANLSLSAVTGDPAPGQGGTTDPSPGNHSFSVGSTVSVRSIPNTDYRFSKWTGDVVEAATFSTSSKVIMDTNKLLSANFCTQCADVNGDLKITPADAQMAFDIYLGKIANPTWCELENADVNCSGTKFAPKVTPADAQTIFHKYLKKGVYSSDCSGNSRVAALATQSLGFSSVSITISNVTFATGKDVVIPITVESATDIKAFGFDLSYPSDSLAYVGLESTELTYDFNQLDANVLIYQGINQESPKPRPGENFTIGFDPSFTAKILTVSTINSRPSQEFGSASTDTGDFRLLRVGGYKTESMANPTSGILVKLIFRVIGEVKDPGSISIIATYDDIKNASIKNDGMINRQNTTQIREKERPAENNERKLAGKRYHF
jgi:PKD repeat protein